jgi:hypothetical protein
MSFPIISMIYNAKHQAEDVRCQNSYLRYYPLGCSLIRDLILRAGVKISCQSLSQIAIYFSAATPQPLSLFAKFFALGCAAIPQQPFNASGSLALFEVAFLRVHYSKERAMALINGAAVAQFSG